ncbi:adenosine receptor A1 [Sphaeramia orbicularis]|uniref:adenosine receptor A1 n=1 Tax=Sphaeramia orbicularis TaxID=375764 RepID=UPI0011813994|nr:adenosine receptor A1-like [Sphaeramia orbicularis]
MEFMWLYSLCQCILFVSVIVVSVRLCMAVSGGGTVAGVQEGTQGATHQSGSISFCLRLCLGWVGAAGGAVEVPVNVLLNLRSPQCLYTCITLVCCPLLVRQFTMFLLMLLVLDSHLQHHLADRYSSVVTRQRALCVVLLCWVGSVLSSFAEFIGSDLLHTWRSSETGLDPGTAGLADLGGNWTTSIPRPAPSSFPKYYQDLKVIGKYLPYGGFLSKFYVEDMHNFTYAEIHSSHWGVCAHDTILSPQFLVYVYGSTVFILPLLCLLVIYLDLLCMKPRETPFTHADPSKHDSRWLRSLALSISLLVLLCLPIHIIHALFLFTPSTNVPAWVHRVAVFLFQLYSLVPPLLFTPPKKTAGVGQASFPHSVAHLPPWSSAKHSLKAKVCPEV